MIKVVPPQARVAKNLKVPPAKAKELIASMLKHAQKRK